MKLITTSRAVRCERICGDNSSRAITGTKTIRNPDGSITQSNMVLDLIKEIREMIADIEARIVALTPIVNDKTDLYKLMQLETQFRKVFT